MSTINQTDAWARFAAERHRQEITRTLVEQAFLGFLALDDSGKREFIERFNRFHQNLGHRDAARYEIRDTRV